MVLETPIQKKSTRLAESFHSSYQYNPLSVSSSDISNLFWSLGVGSLTEEANKSGHAAGINVSHYFNLVASLLRIRLVDADLVYPE